MAAFLDHIGVAVTPGSRLALCLEILGLPVAGTEQVESERVEVTWVPLPLKPARVELLVGTDPTGTIAKFSQKQGRDAIHHLSFRVDSIKASMQALEAAGFKFVYPEARPGADECLVNFIHPSTTGGLLLELTEKNSSN